MSFQQRQTTREILADVDLLICMRQEHLDFCQNLGYKDKFEMWDIPDLNEMDNFVPSTRRDIKIDVNHIELSEQTFEMITEKVDELLKRL